jgi:AraC-like DNA-binding protein
VEYLNRIGELRFRAPAVSTTAIKGLLLAEFSLLLALVEEQTPQRYSETERVFRCQWLIRNNLEDPELGVAALAAELRCSPGHLSKLFHQETGERIVEHISRLRLQNAIEALRATTLSVKEIAVACGYHDANYFARVFRQSTGRSPQEYRMDLQRVTCALEKQPKAVFHDHEEFGFALKPEVMAAATVQTGR